MKKAKVRDGVIQHVWPVIKTKPDGSRVVKELPPQYRGRGGKSVPDYIIDVSDEVQQGWVWNGEKYAPRRKQPRIDGGSDLLRVIALELGLDYNGLWRELVRLKRRRLGLPAKD